MAADPAAPERADWHTPAELAPLVRRSAYTIREHLRDGTMHGHMSFGRWSVKGTVGDAFVEGLDPAAQRRICGCEALRAVPARGGRRRTAG